MSEPRAILVLGAGAYQLAVYERLRAAGFRTIAVDRAEDAPGFDLADDFAVADVADPDAVLEAARARRVAGVMPLNEFGVRAAAHVAATLDLIGNSPQTALAATDKGVMRQRWEETGVPNPDFRVVTDEREARAAWSELGPPLVVKPTDAGGGGRGISVANDGEEFRAALEFAWPFARAGRLIVERQLEGTELSVESVSWRGEVHVLAIGDRTTPRLRTRVATRLTYPADLAPEAADAVRQATGDAVRALGIADGPAHTELMLGPEGVLPLEVGARGGGGHIFSTVVRAVSGVDMVAESARVLVGDAPDLHLREQQGCVYEFLAPPAGVLRDVRGLEEARAMPGVLDVGITRSPGEVVGELINSLDRSGFAVVVGRDRGEALRRAEDVVRSITFDMLPVPDAV